MLFVLALTGVIAFSAGLRALVAVQMNLHFFHSPPVHFPTLYVYSFINIAVWVLLIAGAKMLLERIRTQQKLALLEKERIKNELDYLKAQINPHALFNSLNTIYGQIDKSNSIARDILLQFSELLRYQLYECAVEKVGLEKEMAYLKNYVSFQSLRKDENLLISLDVEQIGTGLTIAPLMLIVLVENAFKFVSNFPDKENRICIRIYTLGNILRINIRNTIECEYVSPVNPNRIGIANLKRRLELLYAGKYQLSTLVEQDCFEANLIIDLV
jgi:two-component system LytT family sensor kinase